MRGARAAVAAIMALAAGGPAFAVEGPTGAGPIGGTDIRSAMLPPPGLYVGGAVLGAATYEFVGGNGETAPGLGQAWLAKEVGGPFVYYVPNVKLFGGSIGIGGETPYGNQCGRLFPGQDTECNTSFGDPYVEADWSRSFTTPRASKYAGAYPILQGLTVMTGFGTIIPAGLFDASTPLRQAISNATNIWDFAPNVAVTYTTAPILFEGTEISAKAYWNSYLENPRTHYQTGDLLDVDFAVTEHIGRFQIGAAGYYVNQLDDDTKFGVKVPPDGNQAEILTLGGVIAYDMPEYNASMKLKALDSVVAANTVKFWGVVFTWIKKI